MPDNYEKFNIFKHKEIKSHVVKHKSFYKVSDDVPAQKRGGGTKNARPSALAVCHTRILNSFIYKWDKLL